MSGGHSNKLHSMFGGSCYSELGEHHAGPKRKMSSNYMKNILQQFHLALQVVGDDLLEAAVQPLPVLVQDHGVSIAVQLLEGESRVVLPLNFLKKIIKFLLLFFIILQLDKPELLPSASSKCFQHTSRPSSSGMREFAFFLLF